MAEPPERKALKSLLVKLKANSISYEATLKEKVKEVGRLFEEMAKLIEKQIAEMKTDEAREVMAQIRTLVAVIGMSVGALDREMLAAVEHLKLYVEALEESYKHLDETFEKAVYEPARQQAEAMIKEQKELEIKKKPEFYG